MHTRGRFKDEVYECRKKLFEVYQELYILRPELGSSWMDLYRASKLPEELEGQFESLCLSLKGAEAELKTLLSRRSGLYVYDKKAMQEKRRREKEALQTSNS